MNPFDIKIECIRLPTVGQYPRYELRVYYQNPPPTAPGYPGDSFKDITYARKHLEGETLDLNRVYRLCWEALMDRFAAVFGDEGSYELQPWRQIWLAHQHTIKRALKKEIDSALQEKHR